MSDELIAALEALADQAAPGMNEARVEAVVDREINEVLIALANDLGGGQRRSEAVRTLFRRGAKAMLADLRRKRTRGLDAGRIDA